MRIRVKYFTPKSVRANSSGFGAASREGGRRMPVREKSEIFT
jgi:hypothetical protein